MLGLFSLQNSCVRGRPIQVVHPCPAWILSRNRENAVGLDFGGLTTFATGNPSLMADSRYTCQCPGSTTGVSVTGSICASLTTLDADIHICITDPCSGWPLFRDCVQVTGFDLTKLTTSSTGNTMSMTNLCWVSPSSKTRVRVTSIDLAELATLPTGSPILLV